MSKGKKGKKTKSTQSKKGKAKVSSTQNPQEEMPEMNDSSEAELGEVTEKLQSKLQLEEDDLIEAEVVVPDQKNNNPTPIKSEEPHHSGDHELMKESSASTSSVSSNSVSGLDRKNSVSVSTPTENKDPFEVHYSASINYNNNFCESKKLKESLGEAVSPVTPKRELVIKHPLLHTWTFWWFSNKSKSWEAKEVISFSTIEDFWGAYNWIQPPSQLGVNNDYAVFKKGIKPDWEDHNNALGGRWVTERNRTEDIDTYWLETLFMLVGEHMEPHSNMINGAVVQKKKGKFRLALWLKDSSSWSERSIDFIGRFLKKRLNIPKSDSLDFRVHSTEQKRPVGRLSGKSLNASTLFSI